MSTLRSSASAGVEFDLNQLTEKIIGCAIKVPRVLGPGLLESAYEICLTHELHKTNLKAVRQVPPPVVYDGIKLDAGYQLDIVLRVLCVSVVNILNIL